MDTSHQLPTPTPSSAPSPSAPVSASNVTTGDAAVHKERIMDLMAVAAASSSSTAARALVTPECPDEEQGTSESASLMPALADTSTSPALAGALQPQPHLATPAETPREYACSTEETEKRPNIAANLTSVAEAVACLVHNANDASPDDNTPAPTADNADDEANCANAWDHLKQLESFYRQFTERIFELKTRETDALHQTITNCTHHELVADMCKLEDQRVRWLQSSKWRLQCQREAIEREYAASSREVMRSYQYKKASARCIMQRRIQEMQRLLTKDHEARQRKRLGQRLDSLKNLFPINNHQRYHSRDFVSFEDDEFIGYAPPVVDQFLWQRKRNSAVLQSYHNTKDGFDVCVPPRLMPRSLGTYEINSDIRRLRQASEVLRTLAVPEKEFDVISAADDMMSQEVRDVSPTLPTAADYRSCAVSLLCNAD